MASESVASFLGLIVYPSAPAMAYRPALELATYDHLSPEARERILVAMVEVLISANLEFLALYPRTLPLYDSTMQKGVVYVFNFDRWQDIASCLDRMQGDCKDLAAWRIAELRRGGVLATVHVLSRLRQTPAGPAVVYHVQVMLPTGEVEDPSVMAGMNPAGAFSPT